MTTPKVIIHLHVFNLAVLDEIEVAARNIVSAVGAGNAFAVITYPENVPSAESAAKAISLSCGKRLTAVPNRGYDIGPFVCEVLNKANLDDFDLVAKLHTKRDIDIWLNFRKLQGPTWRRELLRPFASASNAKRSIVAFMKWQQLGYLAGHRIINYCGTNDLPEAEETAKWLYQELSLSVNHLVTAHGSIFMTRTSVLKPFANRYSWNDFVEVTSDNAHREYGLATRLERSFAMAADAMGFVVSEGRYSPSIAIAGYRIQSTAFKSLRAITKLIRK